MSAISAGQLSLRAVTLQPLTEASVQQLFLPSRRRPLQISHPLIALITGEESLEHGYSDRYRLDGLFGYFGEGQSGDMRMRTGNLAIAEHSANGKSLLLFRKFADELRFEGEMICESYHIERAPDRDGIDRAAIVFELRPLQAVSEWVETVPVAASLSTNALLAATQSAQPATKSQRNVYQRSQDVRAYVLASAKGNCEGCDAPAPFFRIGGTP